MFLDRAGDLDPLRAGKPCASRASYLYVACLEMRSRHAAFASNLDGSIDASAAMRVLARFTSTRQRPDAGVLSS